MIPILLRLSGFLSYREPVEIDFSGFDIACISGANGAGKSSLLDAITWALFGQARKRDEALINTHPDTRAAEVTFTFAYEKNIYRVMRALPRGKTTLLEFQILDRTMPADDDRLTGVKDLSIHKWNPLSERTLRETQARIENILRLDYETFINAAFFLQGKADQFTQQSSSKRKEILGNLLGLNIWDSYKENTAERRKNIERDLTMVEGHILELDAELSEEESRKKNLAQLESELKGLSGERKIREISLENAKRTTAALKEKQKQREMLVGQISRNQLALNELDTRLINKQAERDAYAMQIKSAKEIEASYQSWQSTRLQLEEWNKLADKFHEHENRRRPLLETLAAEKARLEQEKSSLLEQSSTINEQLQGTERIKEELVLSNTTLAELEEGFTRRSEMSSQRQVMQEKQASLRTDNSHLKTEMDELMLRIEKLKVTKGAVCPLCGQPLSPSERKKLIEQLNLQGKEMGNTWRSNRKILEKLETEFSELETHLGKLSELDEARLQQTAKITQLSEKLATSQRTGDMWEKAGAKRLAEITTTLEANIFALDVRKDLEKVDQELIEIGYDAATHDSFRRTEIEGRGSEINFMTLEKAKSALEPLEDELKNLKLQIKNQKMVISDQQHEMDSLNKELEKVEAEVPDISKIEGDLLDLQEKENRLNQDVGAARQKVTVLDDLRKRKIDLEAEAEQLKLSIANHKQLERAFGRDGVQALLIEQALPDIQYHANELLDRLSNGTMSMSFITLAEYKNKKRDDLKETLDIKISDGTGTRDYETYSGGETFRVNFAIRLALSRVLAQRKGARLQTLVVDEGFGSQDEQGRQRLIEVINAVKGDFEKILIITHLDELKDAFPTRVEVEKGERGSVVRVI